MTTVPRTVLVPRLNVGLAIPVPGPISFVYIDPSLGEEGMRGTLAHEAGHTRFGLGHDKKYERFDRANQMCSGIWKAAENDYANSPECKYK
jgi:hypothetical protein